MRIAVFGLGYVGSVTAACLAKMGHTVAGVDVSAAKVGMVNSGHSPVAEEGLEIMTARVVRQKRLRAIFDPEEAVRSSEISLVAVGTPSREDGSVDLDHVEKVFSEIGRALRATGIFHTVALRSTVPPGTTARVVIPLLERISRKKAGRDFGVCFHPEFLREGSSVYDFFRPPKTVIGSQSARCTKPLLRLWRTIRAPLFVTSLEVAEMVKYADNAFHALKISFANEMGSLARSCGADGQEVMDIFVRDTKLNVSPLYLKPGFAFGGPCLPKDVRALCSMGRRNRVAVPLLEGILQSNSDHLRRAVDMVLATGVKKVGILGLAFKSGTDDLRESPACALIRELLRAKRKVRVYDPNIRMERLLGANRAFAERELPALPRLLAPSLADLLRSSEVIVVAADHHEFRLARGQVRNAIVIDLIHAFPSGKSRM